MTKRWAVAGVLAAVATVGAGTLAGAEPTKNVETLTCGGETVEVAVAGRNGWIEGERFKAVQFVIEGEGFTEVKVYGGGKDLGRPDAFTCTQEFPGAVVTITIVPA